MKTILSLALILMTCATVQAQNINDGMEANRVARMMTEQRATHERGLQEMSVEVPLIKETGERSSTTMSMAEYVVMSENPAACKIIASRWTGSGGYNGQGPDENGDSGGLVSTNGHVAPQLQGRYSCQFLLPNGIARQYTGIAKLVIYDRVKPYDYSLLHVKAIGPDFPIKPIACSTTAIAIGQDVFTTGSPRGIWPLITVVNKFVRWVSTGINGFGPNNAIGGQSGSDILRLLKADEKPKAYDNGIEFEPRAIAVSKLAWSWSGLMAGQDYSLVYRLVMASDRKAEMMNTPDRPEGLIEVSTFQDRGLIEGIQEVKPNITALARGAAGELWNSKNLSIWYVPDDGQGGGGEEPPPTGELTEAEVEAAKTIRDHGGILEAIAERWSKENRRSDSDDDNDDGEGDGDDGQGGIGSTFEPGQVPLTPPKTSSVSPYERPLNMNRYPQFGDVYFGGERVISYGPIISSVPVDCPS